MERCDIRYLVSRRSDLSFFALDQNASLADHCSDIYCGMECDHLSFSAKAIAVFRRTDGSGGAACHIAK